MAALLLVLIVRVLVQPDNAWPLYPDAADRLGVTAPDTLSVQATRIDCQQPERKASGSSLVTYSQTSFRIGVDLDRSASGRGRAGLRQGYAMLGPKCGS